MYAPTAKDCPDASRGAPVASSTGIRARPPSPKTAPIAAARPMPRRMSRCALHEYSA